MERRMQLVKKDNEKERHKLFQGYETEEREKLSYRRKLNWSASRSLRQPRLCLPSLSPVGGVERDTKGVLITLLHCLDLRSFVCSD